MIKRLSVLLLVAAFVCFSIKAVSTLTALQSDTFTRANALTLGSNWNATGGGGTLNQCQLLSNQAKPLTGGIVGNCFFSAVDWPNDQAVQATLSTITTIGTDDVGVCARGNFGQNTNNCYYAGSYSTNTKVNLLRIVSNSFVVLASSAANVVQGDVIQLQVVGCNPANLTVLQNGTPIAGMNPFVDASPLAPCAGSPGILVFSATPANAGVSNWTGYAISNPGTVNNSAPFPVLSLGAQTNLGNLTGASQSFQFVLPARSELFLGRLAISVGSTTGTVANPAWVLECSQDTGTTWWQVPALLVPAMAPQLGDIFPIYAPFYDVSGFGGASCKFGLGVGSGTVVTGTLPVWVTIG